MTPQPHSPTSYPFVSVIVAAYNAESTICQCLESLLALEYPDYEIIVADNDSQDGTAPLIRQYPVRYLLERKKGWPAARNRAFAASRASIVANIDADCFAERRWLRTLVDALREPGVGGVVGRTRVEEGRTLTEQFYASMDPFNIESKLNAPVVPWGGGNNAYRKVVMDTLGGYDADRFVSGADAEFHERLKRLTDFRMKYVPQAVIYHTPRTSLKQLFLVEAKYTSGGVLRTAFDPDCAKRFSWFVVKKTKQALMNFAGFFYRLAKFTFRRESKLRLASPLFWNVQVAGQMYGYFRAKWKGKTLR